MTVEERPAADPSSFTQKEILTQFVLPALEEIKEGIAEREREHEQRFRALEAAKNRLTGGLSLVIVFLVPLSVPVISALLASTNHG